VEERKIAKDLIKRYVLKDFGSSQNLRENPYLDFMNKKRAQRPSEKCFC